MRTRSLKPGDRAPDFHARRTTGEEVRLSEFRGKKHVVLFFFPKDFTPGCTAEVCSFRDNYDALMAFDAVLLGVSFDDEQTHDAFIHRHRLPFPLISDRDHAIARAYGADGRLWGILPGAKRLTFVIDKEGIISRILHHEMLIG